MSIEQRLEQIEQNQREILRLLHPAETPVIDIPVRNSVRVAEMLARSAKNEDHRKRREELRQWCRAGRDVCLISGVSYPPCPLGSVTRPPERS
jgi:hypothetical protein